MSHYRFSRPVSCRLSTTDVKRLDEAAQASGKSRSDFARTALLAKVSLEVRRVRIRRRGPSDDVLRMLNAELGRHGGLMNQIGKHLNSGGVAGEIKADLARLQVAYSATARAVIELTKLRRSPDTEATPDNVP